MDRGGRPGREAPGWSAVRLTDLRTLQDWVVRPQLRNVPGVTEVNAIGGYEKLYQVAPDPARLVAYGLSFRDVFEALRANNATAGGGYIEKNGEQLLVRATGLIRNDDDIRAIVVAKRDGVAIRMADVADVVVGRDLRTGAATENGREVVIGTAIMLVGSSSRAAVSTRAKERLASAEKSLPEGVKLKTVYDRTYLVDATIHTVGKSLIEVLLVIVVLFLLLGNLRASIVVAVAIPFSMPSRSRGWCRPAPAAT